ncbi:MAG: glycogen synthase, partial [Elusimicrobiaceae bacterium]|nr:glycogen synthase [Elusimicrobiaceae bacterium]
PDKFEYWGGISFLKAGTVFATRATTVSPTYAKELLNGHNSFGFEGVLRSKGPAFSGILNGLDTDVWDPQNDSLIPMGYDDESMRGKMLCKTALLKELGLEVNENIPLFVMVSRLTYQKGIDLVSSVVPALAGKVQFAFLGKGDRNVEQGLKNLANSNPNHIAFCGVVDENLAHKVYAAGDFYLMPSRFEPCGLSQMIAMRYGTLPIVTKTGGLSDTVKGFTDNASINKATGFFMDNFDPNALVYATNNALRIYSNKKELAKMRENAMITDFSWDNSAAAYLKIYENALSLGARW